MSTVTDYDNLTPPDLPQRDQDGVIDVSQMQNGSLIIYLLPYQYEKRFDRITVCVADNIWSETYVITEDIIPDFITFSIPFTKIPDGEYSVIYVACDLLENKNTSQATWVKIINSTAQCGALHVMGARGKYGTERHAETGIWSRTLIALDKNSRKPVVAQWRYQDDTDWLSGERFLDTSPWRPLQVSAADKVVTINPVNISGNNLAFLALRDDGRIVCGRQGENVPPAVSKLDDIVSIASSYAGGFSVLRKNSTVVVWDNDNTVLATQTDVARLFSTELVFAALCKDGSVVAWGEASYGGSVPAEISKLKDITQLAGTELAFAALRKNNSVVAWGNGDFGGNVPSDISELSDIKQLFADTDTFVALRANGSVVAWGFGVIIPPDISNLTDIIRVVGNEHRDINNGDCAFAALRKDGGVVAWGNGDSGGSVPSGISELRDIIDIIGVGDSFLALRSNGTIVQWGRGSLPDEVINMNDIVQIACSSNCDVFAVLRASGQVYSWGMSDDRWRAITHARAIYCNGNAFVALTEDGQVITWGDENNEGGGSAVQVELAHQVSYQRN